jgi:HPt (histidine-containing phosphotransfer) domain-containing protein
LNKPHLAARVLDLFAQTAGRELEKLQKSVADGDLAQLTRQAHMIKGSAGTVSALRVQKSATELEQLGKQGNLLEAQRKADELKIELDQCVAYIRHTQAKATPEPQPNPASV